MGIFKIRNEAQVQREITEPNNFSDERVDLNLNLNRSSVQTYHTVEVNNGLLNTLSKERVLRNWRILRVALIAIGGFKLVALNKRRANELSAAEVRRGLRRSGYGMGENNLIPIMTNISPKSESSKQSPDNFEEFCDQYARFCPATVHRMLYTQWRETGRTNPESLCERIWTTLLFADISGFTRLSARLTAEQLKIHTNQYFTMLINVVVRFGGDIIKFCGDAVMILWPCGADASEDIRQANAMQAAECALVMLGECGEYDVGKGEELVSLRLHCGIGCGFMYCFCVGTEGRWEFLVSGDSLRQIGEAEPEALQGQVIVSPEVWENISHNFSSTKTPKGNFLLKEIPPEGKSNRHSINNAFGGGWGAQGANGTWRVFKPDKVFSGHSTSPSHSIGAKSGHGKVSPLPTSSGAINAAGTLHGNDSELESNVKETRLEQLSVFERGRNMRRAARKKGINGRHTDHSGESREEKDAQKSQSPDFDSPDLQNNSPSFSDLSDSQIIMNWNCPNAQEGFCSTSLGLSNSPRTNTQRCRRSRCESSSTVSSRKRSFSHSFSLSFGQNIKSGSFNVLASKGNSGSRGLFRARSTQDSPTSGTPRRGHRWSRKIILEGDSLESNELWNNGKLSREQAAIYMGKWIEAQQSGIASLNMSKLSTLLRGYTQESARYIIESKLTQYAGELRRVTTLFMNILGLEKHLLEGRIFHVQQVMELGVGCMSLFGGVLRQFVVDDKGCVMIAAFGLPQYSYEDNEARAISAAHEMIQALQGIQLSASIGITAGTVYCGFVGAEKRCEYAMMGACVNLSARLMAAALPNTIYVDNEVYQRVQNVFIFETLTPINAKGYSSPVPIFCPVGHVNLDGSPQIIGKNRAEDLHVGAANELRVMASTAARVAHGIRVRPIWLRGQAGSGKTHLLQSAQFSQLCKDHSMSSVVAVSRNIHAATPYNIWHSILWKIFKSKDYNTSQSLSDLSNHSSSKHRSKDEKVLRNSNSTRTSVRSPVLLGSSSRERHENVPLSGSSTKSSVPKCKAGATSLHSPNRQTIDSVLTDYERDTPNASPRSQNLEGISPRKLPSKELIDTILPLSRVQKSRKDALPVKAEMKNIILPMLPSRDSAKKNKGTAFSELKINTSTIQNKKKAVEKLVSKETLVKTPLSLGNNIPCSIVLYPAKKKEISGLDGLIEGPILSQTGGQMGGSKGSKLRSKVDTVVASPLSLAKSHEASFCNSSKGLLDEEYGGYIQGRVTSMALEGAGEAEKSQRDVIQWIRSKVPKLMDMIPLLEVILNCGFKDTHLTARLDPISKNRKLDRLVMTILRAAVIRQPMMLVVENAQWMDLRSMQLMYKIVNAQLAGLMVVITSRPLDDYFETIPKELVSLKEMGTVVNIGTLSASECLELCRYVIGAELLEEHPDLLPDSSAVLLLQKSGGGNPLLVRNIAATLKKETLENKTPRRLEDIPTGFFHDLIVSLFDALDILEQSVLKAASVIGMTFGMRLLLHILPNTSYDKPSSIHSALLKLIEANFISRAVVGKTERFNFMHASVQETLYEMMLSDQRQHLHEVCAEWYENHHKNSPTFESIIMHHWLRGGNIAKKVQYLQLAAEKAAETNAHEDSINHLFQLLCLAFGKNVAIVQLVSIRRYWVKNPTFAPSLPATPTLDTTMNPTSDTKKTATNLIVSIHKIFNCLSKKKESDNDVMISDESDSAHIERWGLSEEEINKGNDDRELEENAAVSYVHRSHVPPSIFSTLTLLEKKILVNRNLRRLFARDFCIYTESTDANMFPKATIGKWIGEIGLGYYQLGKFIPAHNFMQEALLYLGFEPIPKVELSRHAVLARSMFYTGRRTEKDQSNLLMALRLYEGIASICLKVGNPKEVRNVNILVDRAASEKICEKSRATRACLYTHFAMGELSYENHKQTEELIEEAKMYALNSGSMESEGTVFLASGTYQAGQGIWHTAEKNLNKAFELFASMGNISQCGNAIVESAYVKLCTGDLEEAYRMFLEVSEFAIQKQDKMIQLPSMCGLALMYALTGRYSKLDIAVIQCCRVQENRRCLAIETLRAYADMAKGNYAEAKIALLQKFDEFKRVEISLSAVLFTHIYCDISLIFLEYQSPGERDQALLGRVGKAIKILERRARVLTAIWPLAFLARGRFYLLHSQETNAEKAFEKGLKIESSMAFPVAKALLLLHSTRLQNVPEEEYKAHVLEGRQRLKSIGYVLFPHPN